MPCGCWCAGSKPMPGLTQADWRSGWALPNRPSAPGSKAAGPGPASIPLNARLSRWRRAVGRGDREPLREPQHRQCWCATVAPSSAGLADLNDQARESSANTAGQRPTRQSALCRSAGASGPRPPRHRAQTGTKRRDPRHEVLIEHSQRPRDHPCAAHADPCRRRASGCEARHVPPRRFARRRRPTRYPCQQLRGREPVCRTTQLIILSGRSRPSLSCSKACSPWAISIGWPSTT